MSSKTRKEIEQLAEALDDVPVTNEEAREALRKLGIDVSSWARSIRARIATAEEAELQARVAQANGELAEETRRLDAKKAGPLDPAVQQQVWQDLLARVPPDQQASFHAHKFEKATPEEIAELIKSLRHLLGDDDEET